MPGLLHHIACLPVYLPTNKAGARATLTAKRYCVPHTSTVQYNHLSSTRPKLKLTMSEIKYDCGESLQLIVNFHFRNTLGLNAIRNCLCGLKICFSRPRLHVLQAVCRGT